MPKSPSSSGRQDPRKGVSPVAMVTMVMAARYAVPHPDESRWQYAAYPKARKHWESRSRQKLSSLIKIPVPPSASLTYEARLLPPSALRLERIPYGLNDYGRHLIRRQSALPSIACPGLSGGWLMYPSLHYSLSGATICGMRE